MSKPRDITQLIERLEAFEDRAGIRLEALYADLDENDCITVNGEVHSTIGTTLPHDIELVAAVYDANGRMISTQSEHFSADRFFAFEVFSVILEGKAAPVRRLRLYPKVG